MPLIWFDAEFTSLNLETAGLLQIAAMATDANLQRILPPKTDLNLFIQPQPEQKISPWVKENIPHIVAKALAPTALTLPQADQQLADYIDQVTATTPSDQPPLLAGNSIHNDWHLARRLLPKFMSKMHYRLLDISTLKTLHSARGGNPPDKENDTFLKQYFPSAVLEKGAAAHDAYYDIQASAAELAYYQNHLFVAK